MNNLRDIFIAGCGLFFGTAALTAVAYCYFLYSTRKALRLYSADEFETHFAKSYWIYVAQFNACVAFGALYLLQYYGLGFGTVFTPHIIIWLRWLVYAVVGGVYVGLLAYVMTPRPHGAQSFFACLLYVVAMLTLLYASVTEKREGEIILATLVIFWLAQALALLFWPLNKIAGRDWQRVRDIVFSEPSVWHLLFRPRPRGERESAIVLWAFIYRLFFVVQLCVSHAGLLLTWFLSDAQGFTDVAGLRQSFLAYLVFDAILLLPLAWFYDILTFMGVVRKFSARALAEPHHKSIEAAAKPSTSARVSK